MQTEVWRGAALRYPRGMTNTTPFSTSVLSVVIGSATSVVATGGDLFDADTRYPVANHPIALATGDFDQDGDVDVAATCVPASSVVVLWNDGLGHFDQQSWFPSNHWLFQIESADMDGDGDLDLVAASNDSTGKIVILVNDGSGIFDTEHDFDIEIPRGIAVADLDGDGRNDVAASTSNPVFPEDHSVTLLTNAGNGNLLKEKLVDVGLWATGIHAADLDGDGDSDLAVTNRFDDDISVLLNGDLGTTWQQTRHAVGDLPDAATSADWNQDGLTDLAVLNIGDDSVSLLQNQGGAVFGGPFDPPAPAIAIPGNIVAMVAADFDLDGLPDIALANSTGLFLSDVVVILLNDGAITFNPPDWYTAGPVAEDIAAADLDADGDIDLVVANRGSDDISILLNRQSKGSICSPDLNGDSLLDLQDLTLFIEYFTSQDDGVDFAEPLGIWDLADIVEFVSLFASGCP